MQFQSGSFSDRQKAPLQLNDIRSLRPALRCCGPASRSHLRHEVLQALQVPLPLQLLIQARGVRQVLPVAVCFCLRHLGVQVLPRVREGLEVGRDDVREAHIRELRGDLARLREGSLCRVGGIGAREEGDEGGAEAAEDAQLAPEGRAGVREAVVEALLQRGLLAGCYAFTVARLYARASAVRDIDIGGMDELTFVNSLEIFDHSESCSTFGSLLQKSSSSMMQVSICVYFASWRAVDD